MPIKLSEFDRRIKALSGITDASARYAEATSLKALADAGAVVADNGLAVDVQVVHAPSQAAGAMDEHAIRKSVEHEIRNLNNTAALQGTTFRQKFFSAAHSTIENKAMQTDENPVRGGHRTRAFSGPDGEAKSHRFGMWALACLGKSEKAAQWCADAGLITKTGVTFNNSLGGFLVPDPLERDLIDLREQYGVFRRNAHLRTMTSDTLKIPRRQGGLTAAFVGEAQPGTSSTKEWGQVQLVARKIRALTRISSELNEDTRRIALSLGNADASMCLGSCTWISIALVSMSTTTLLTTLASHSRRRCFGIVGRV
jgi:hypothetical protein